MMLMPDCSWLYEIYFPAISAINFMYDFFYYFSTFQGRKNVEGRQVWAEPIHKSEKLNLSNYYDDDDFFVGCTSVR